MTVKFYGHNQDGASQTGKGEVVHLWLAHEVGATGVIASRAQLVADGIMATADVSVNNITINGVTYTTNALYDQAYAAQKNLDNLVASFSVFANPVYVNVSDGIVTTTPVADTTTNLIGGADLLGSALIQAAGLVWEVELAFEQKGMFTSVPGTAGFTKGEASISSGTNYGSSVADIHAILEGTPMYVTGLLAAGGDSENMVDADAAVAFADGVPLNGGAAIAFTGAQGDLVYVVSAGNAAQATSQTAVVEVQVAPDLQS